MTFAGVVVTYNRKEELLKNIHSVLKQEKRFDKFYIIDNCSTDGTYEYLKEQGILNYDFIEFVSLDSNVGGAGGFYYGMKYAYENGFDFICLMDDDGRPICKDTFSVLFEKAKRFYKKNHKLMLNSLVVCDELCEKLSFGLGRMVTAKEVRGSAQNGVITDLINPFIGTLISKELVKEIGYQNREFFIRGDEVDYQSRAAKAGACVATIVDSVYFHPSSEVVPLKWKGQIVYVGICSPWKSYYLVRNYCYRVKRDLGNLAAIKQFLFQIYATLKCNPEGKACIKMLVKGFFDGMHGRLGNRVLPGQK